jgi:hypothetical protein
MTGRGPKTPACLVPGLVPARKRFGKRRTGLLYQDVVEIAKKYLGDTAQTFIDRQLLVHMKIRPDELSPAHITNLGHWCYISATLRLRDAQKSRNFEADILKLDSPHP